MFEEYPCAGFLGDEFVGIVFKICVKDIVAEDDGQSLCEILSQSQGLSNSTRLILYFICELATKLSAGAQQTDYIAHIFNTGYNQYLVDAN